MSETLAINEIFFSIQGESSFAGRPCAFVRLAHCDLRCSWCDTEYAFYQATRMSIPEILGQVQAYPTHLVEVTGGEPLLQKAVHPLIARLLEVGKQVLIETGGHRDISPVHPDATLIYDIKCPESGMADRNCWENLSKLRPQDEIKFVIASRLDFDWAKTILARHQLASRHVILFSAVWDRLSPRHLAEWILADGLPVRMQLQMHKLLWEPDRRGV